MRVTEQGPVSVVTMGALPLRRRRRSASMGDLSLLRSPIVLKASALGLGVGALAGALANWATGGGALRGAGVGAVGAGSILLVGIVGVPYGADDLNFEDDGTTG